ncbi:serine/threonine-protein kinase [Tuwongella immobilis]|uniref:Protein kinase domain-containing protein n=1 Tax=Tuwongella immobilis TaxID=692036 RepID=A0A6C2YTH3_9BACT|nr:serine/threonine-protein kinase [Tuwongella immobilis]VIP04329.1 serine threonine protein kinase : Serine/threonine protein kinase OS=Isosphaera pallida (strain ATCC 43644 / DSM 9630 / IS1B) GN=Isop_0234 PE=3 SV=1: Pkinase [Tuwongella immobilis]VTS06020.1 serine threonine protein kinase : Serine/threonine protein kinase OS=Isosphaera pallida (strain ATCC 43644 / DSM 9630 / IS1B) GN=Isop_0234 PE=3 SV=1: Pkinase [Tuwongella immobilis]
MTTSSDSDAWYTGQIFPGTDHSAARAAILADLGDRYSLETHLGTGAYATVWHARDRQTGESVALKCFEQHSAQSGSFYRELSALFRLNDPHVVRIINLMEAGPTRRYLILEYCPGGSLRPLISRMRRAGGRLPLESVARLGLQIALGLQAAHRQGVVHRDLKPENVLLVKPSSRLDDPQIRLKLADFGLARSISRGTPPEGELPTISGSPAYMAPEQFHGETSPASDVYALGVMLFELLHGNLPFEGAPAQLALAHLRQSPPIAASLPADWVALLEQLLAKSATDRPTLESVCQRLQQWQPTTTNWTVTPATAIPAVIAEPEPVSAAVPIVRSPREIPRIETKQRFLGVESFRLFVTNSGDGTRTGVACTSVGCFRLDWSETPRSRLLVGMELLDVTRDGAGKLWLASDRTLERICPRTGARSVVIRLGDRPRCLAASDDRLAFLGETFWQFLAVSDGRTLATGPLDADRVGPIAARWLDGDRLLFICGANWDQLVLGSPIPQQARTLEYAIQSIGGGWPGSERLLVQMAHPSTRWGLLDWRMGKITPIGGPLAWVGIHPWVESGTSAEVGRWLGLSPSGELWRGRWEQPRENLGKLPAETCYTAFETDGVQALAIGETDGVQRIHSFEIPTWGRV